MLQQVAATAGRGSGVSLADFSPHAFPVQSLATVQKGHPVSVAGSDTQLVFTGSVPYDSARPWPHLERFLPFPYENEEQQVWVWVLVITLI